MLDTEGGGVTEDFQSGYTRKYKKILTDQLVGYTLGIYF